VEDYLVVFSWVSIPRPQLCSSPGEKIDNPLKFLTISLTILACEQTQYGLGHHEYDVPLSVFSVSQKLGYFNQLLYNLVLCTTKLSICFLYLRIFHVEKRIRWLIHGCIWFLIIYSFAFEIICIFQCHPIRAFWDFSASLKGKCINTIPVFYAAGACNIVSDLLLMAIVVPKIGELQIRKGQKIALFGIVSLGWLIVTASVVRVVRLSILLHTQDPAWASYDITIWSSVEVNIGIICASVPATKPLLATFMPPFMTRLTTQHRSQEYTKSYAADSFPAIEMT
jgi:hypothetical protein